MKSNNWGKIRRKYLLILVVLSLLISMVSCKSIKVSVDDKDSEELTEEMKIEDFKYMYDVISESEANKKLENNNIVNNNEN